MNFPKGGEHRKRNILIKKVPEGLLRAVNIAAIKAGKTQTEWLMEVMADASEYEKRQKRWGGQWVEDAEKEVRPGKICGRHEKGMIDMGGKWGCEGPPFHAEEK
jgi:hypothetical protein